MRGKKLECVQHYFQFGTKWQVSELSSYAEVIWRKTLTGLIHGLLQPVSCLLMLIALGNDHSRIFVNGITRHRNTILFVVTDWFLMKEKMYMLKFYAIWWPSVTHLIFWGFLILLSFKVRCYLIALIYFKYV